MTRWIDWDEFLKPKTGDQFDRCDRCDRPHEHTVTIVSMCSTRRDDDSFLTWALCPDCASGVMLYVIDELPFDYDNAP